MRSHPRLAALLVIVLGTAMGGAACSGGSNGAGTIAGPIRVTSPAFQEGGLIPINFTCVQDGLSPPLAWSARPSGTKGWAVVVVDTDVANGGFVHWVLSGLKPSVASLGINLVPAGAVASLAGNDRPGYVGLCPPQGQLHHYTVTVYALRQALKLTAATSTADALSAIRGAAIANGTLTGRFAR